MAFRPINDQRHAITEVVFGARLSSAPTPGAIEEMVALHATFKDELPRLSKGATFALYFGDAVPPDAPPSTVAFESFKPDGTHAWRLRIEGDKILVNCLDYSRWDQVSAKAYELLNKISAPLFASNATIEQILLQYLDRFEWQGDRAAYDAGQLLKPDSAMMPAHIFDRGPLWHCYQGWFFDIAAERHQRVLERVQITSALESGEDTKLLVTIDDFMQLKMEEPLSFEQAFRNENGTAKPLFELLHANNKSTLNQLLTDEMTNRIELNGKQE
tara:strand:- start:1162 stop:1977 length:816 start_codon:yes stop_codon:yes gene_type:complete